MPPSADYIRFDEIEDVLASVDLVALLAPLVREKPQLWKWLIVGAHDAFQGAMVSAFRDSTGTSILTKESAAQVLDWHNADVSTRGEHPKERLASFGALLNRCMLARLTSNHLRCRPISLRTSNCCIATSEINSPTSSQWDGASRNLGYPGSSKPLLIRSMN